MARWHALQKRTKYGLAAGSVLVFFLLAFQLFNSSTAQAVLGPLTATLSEIFGEVLARPSADEEFAQVEDSLVLDEGAQVKTLEDSRVRLDLSDGSIIRLASLTLFTLEGQEAEGGNLLTRIKMETGKLWVIVSGGAVEVDTPSGVASVRGSYMSVELDPETGAVIITCLEGQCSLTNAGGTVFLTAGQTAYALNYNTPPQIGEMTDEDVQDWLQANPEATLVVLPLTATTTLVITPSAIFTTTGSAGGAGSGAGDASPSGTPTPTGTAGQSSGSSSATPTTGSGSGSGGGGAAPTSTPQPPTATNPPPPTATNPPPPTATNPPPPTATNPPPPTATDEPPPPSPTEGGGGGPGG